jgi:serine/threonine protein kinase
LLVGFSIDVVAFIMRQVFEALAYLHSNDVVHRDIKPSNILLSHSGHVQLADFGLAKRMASRSPDSFQRFFMTNRVCTIWYRAPELLLGSIKYGTEVDVWSAGCVMAELLNGRPLFTGENEFAQLDLITKKLPLTESEAEALNGLPWAHLFRTTAHDRDCIIHDPKDVETEDLLKSCFRFIPKERLTAKEALKHPFFKRTSKDKLVLPDTDWHEFESNKNKRQTNGDTSKDASIK